MKEVRNRIAEFREEPGPAELQTDRCPLQPLRHEGSGHELSAGDPRGETASAWSTDRTLHLQLDQAIHFDGVFHRQLFDQRLDEAGHNHRAGFGFAQPAAH